MDDFAVLIAGLDGLSLFIGAVVGLLIGVGLLLLTRYNMKKTFQSALDTQKEGFDSALSELKASFSSLSSEALAKNQQDFLSLADRELGKKTEQHASEMESKKVLIDQSLESMSKSMTETLNTVPANLEKNENRVTEVLDKSTKDLKESNQSYLSQMTEKAQTQTKEHFTNLENKEVQINRTLSEMKDKLGKVEELIQEFEKARENKLGALDDQLKNLTQTTSALQRALADNQARGQWGERIAEQILEYLGLREGVSYLQQATTPSGARPDFTFLLPNSLSIHMDCKFPIDNYLKYVEADTEGDRSEYSKSFLRNVEMHVNSVTERGYIHDGTWIAYYSSSPTNKYIASFTRRAAR